jgi:hypothetical protein
MAKQLPKVASSEEGIINQGHDLSVRQKSDDKAFALTARSAAL